MQCSHRFLMELCTFIPRVCCLTAVTAAGRAKVFRAETAQEEPHLGSNMLEDRARVRVWVWGWTMVAVVGREAAWRDRVRRLLASPDREDELRMQRAIESLLAMFWSGRVYLDGQRYLVVSS